MVCPSVWTSVMEKAKAQPVLSVHLLRAQPQSDSLLLSIIPPACDTVCSPRAL